MSSATATATATATEDEVEQEIEDAIGADEIDPDEGARAIAWRAMVHTKQREARRLRGVYQEKAEAAKKAKKAYESAAEELIDMEEDEPEEMPLFDKPTSAWAEPWEPVPLSTLGISDHAIQLLEDNEPSIRTVGDLARWTASHQLEDVRGIGETKAVAITEALDKFWADRRAKGLDGAERDTPGPEELGGEIDEPEDSEDD